MSLELTDGRVVWTLPSEVNIYSVAELKTSMNAALVQKRDVVCQMKQVEDFDGAGLQFLMAGREFAAQQNCGFAVSKPGPDVLDALQAMGLSNMIGE